VSSCQQQQSTEWN